MSAATPSLSAPRNLSLDAIGDMYRQHHGWLRSWLWAKLGSHPLAEDLAQDTFERIISARDRLAAAEARALLTTVAKGMVVDLWRRQTLERAYLEALALRPAELASCPETRALVLEALVAVDRMLDSLPSKVRRAFLRVQLDGLSYAEVAAELQVSLSSVQQYMSRAYQACYAVQHG